MRLSYTDEAQENLDQVLEYITEVSGDDVTARVFVDRIRAKCRQLAGLPATLGTRRVELGDGIRSTPFVDYLIYFRYRADMFEIVAVLHGRQDSLAYFDRYETDSDV